MPLTNTQAIDLRRINDALIEKHKVQLNYYQRVLKDMYKQDIIGNNDKNGQVIWSALLKNGG